MKREKDKNFVKSLERGMKVFSFVIDSNDHVGITKIAKDLDLSIGAVQRLTYTLVKLGYLRKDENTHGYTAGHKAWAMGLRIVRDIDIKHIAHPHLEELSRQIEETVNLAILEDTEIVYIDRIKTERILDINLKIGSKLPVYCTSMGKALLSFLPEEEILKKLDKLDLEPLTSKTITDKKKLLRELHRVREKGFAVCDGETDINLRSVAIPIRDASGRVVAASNIAVLSNRVSMEELTTKLANKLMQVTRIISEALGYKERQ